MARRAAAPGPSAGELAAHRADLDALSDEPPEQHAWTFLEQLAPGAGERFGGRPAVSFELISRGRTPFCSLDADCAGEVDPRFACPKWVAECNR